MHPNNGFLVNSREKASNHLLPVADEFRPNFSVYSAPTSYLYLRLQNPASLDVSSPPQNVALQALAVQMMHTDATGLTELKKTATKNTDSCFSPNEESIKTKVVQQIKKDALWKPLIRQFRRFIKQTVL